MENTANKDINSMNLEEARAYAILMEKRAEAEKKRADDAIAALDKLLAEFRDKENIIRRYNLQRFVGTADNIGVPGMNEKDKDEDDADKSGTAATAKPKKSGRPADSKNFGLTDSQLEELSKENEPIILNALDKVPENERSLYIQVSEEIGYQIELVQKTIIVKKVIRNVFKNKKDGSFLKEPSHAPIRGSMASPSILSDILQMKYGFGVPHYRYDGWLRTQPIPISCNTLYNWTKGACDSLLPVYKRIREMFRNAEVVHVDETPIRTVDAKDRINGYIFVFSAVIDGRTVRYYHFSETRKTDIVEEVLGKDFKGIIVVDGYDGYDRFSECGMGLQRCWVHADRKFKDIVKGAPKEKKAKCHAKRVVDMFSKVFSDEHEICQIGFRTPEDRMRMRNEPARRKHVEELVAELEKISSEYAAKSNMKQAADYFLNDKDSFLYFLRDGRAPIENSEAERTVKPYTLARRNFLFVRGSNGGDCSAIALTMIQNAYANQLEPMSYMRVCLEDAYKGNADDLPWDESLRARVVKFIPNFRK